MAVVRAARMPPGLATSFMECVRQFAATSIRNQSVCSFRGQFIRSTVRLGSRGDSYYEYLLYVFIFHVDLHSMS